MNRRFGLQSLLLALLLALESAPAMAQAPNAASKPAMSFGYPVMPGVNSMYAPGWRRYYYPPGFGYGVYPPVAIFRPENVSWYYPQGPATPAPVNPATIGVSPAAIGVRPLGR